MINYQIKVMPNAHLYNVSLTFMATCDTHYLKLPTWIPGSYMIREFSRSILSISIASEKTDTVCEQVNKNTWQVSGLKRGSQVKVVYTVYGYEAGIRSCFLDFKRGYFNPTSLCVYVKGFESCPHQLELIDLPSSWKSISGLKKVQEHKYIALNYDELIDSPFELGEFRQISFMIGETRFDLVLSGIIPARIDEKSLVADISKICQAQINLFGGVPFANYIFMLHLSDEIYTGLEHRNSTALLAPYTSVPVVGGDKLSDKYIKLLGLISHEFFHVWNVKSIKPKAFDPYDLEVENYTDLLWWFEGITSYYDDLFLYRAGLIDKNRYLQIVLDSINSVYKYAGVSVQSLIDASKLAWIKYYRPDANSPNMLVSYYTKGALVGLCLDLLIREKTAGLKSLDDVLRGLFKLWQTQSMSIADTYQLSSLIFQFTGCQLSAQIKQFTATTVELPLKALFSNYGLKIFDCQNRAYDEDGKLITNEADLPQQKAVDLGMKLYKKADGYHVIHVYSNTIADSMGLAASDILIAIDGIKLSDLKQQLSMYQDGDIVVLSLFRGSRLLNFEFCYKPSSAIVKYLLIEDSERLEKWLTFNSCLS